MLLERSKLGGVHKHYNKQRDHARVEAFVSKYSPWLTDLVISLKCISQLQEVCAPTPSNISQ